MRTTSITDDLDAGIRGLRGCHCGSLIRCSQHEAKQSRTASAQQRGHHRADTTPLPAVREANYSGLGDKADLALAAFGLGWHYEAGLQWVRLAAAGMFDELPDLQIILGHWGEVVLFYLERISAVFERALELGRPLAAYARDNLYVTGSGMWSEAYLLRCLEIVGPERLLFSTDFPYQYRQGGGPRRFIEEASIDDATRAGLAHGNWDRLTGATRHRTID